MGVNPLVGIRAVVPPRAERLLLLTALDLAGSPNDAEAQLDPGIDWAFLVPYAEERCALPALADYVARSPAAGALPSAARAGLDDAALRNELQNRVLLRDLADVVKTLQTAGIPSIALKGAALLATHPRLLRIRHTDDIDLWVADEHLDEAYGKLREAGLREHGYHLEPGEAFGHQLQMLATARGTPVEIHRHPPDGYRETFHEALASAERVDLDGVSVALRSGPRLLIDLCGHVALHHVGDPQLWPRHMVDCATLLASRPTLWDEAHALAGFTQRASLWLSRAVLAQTRRPHGGPLADRLVFPIRPGWRGVALVYHALQHRLLAPGAIYRTLLPSLEELNAHGYTGDSLWRAHWKRLRANIDAVRTP